MKRTSSSIPSWILVSIRNTLRKPVFASEHQMTAKINLHVKTGEQVIQKKIITSQTPKWFTETNLVKSPCQPIQQRQTNKRTVELALLYARWKQPSHINQNVSELQLSVRKAERVQINLKPDFLTESAAGLCKTHSWKHSVDRLFYRNAQMRQYISLILNCTIHNSVFNQKSKRDFITLNYYKLLTACSVELGLDLSVGLNIAFNNNPNVQHSKCNLYFSTIQRISV